MRQIQACHEKGQPVLVGTVTIDKSEALSKLLKKAGIKHEVLNAKFHEKEAEIVAQAGKFGAVTIATNMAGRGTDIVLGGNAEFMAKDKMKKMGIDDGLILEATGFADTDNEEILEARRTYKDLYDGFKQETDKEREKVIASGRPVYFGYGAARKPAYRQPAPRAERPSGRRGRIAVLPVAGGRFNAAVRVGAHCRNCRRYGACGRRAD